MNYLYNETVQAPSNFKSRNKFLPSHEISSSINNINKCDLESKGNAIINTDQPWEKFRENQENVNPYYLDNDIECLVEDVQVYILSK